MYSHQKSEEQINLRTPRIDQALQRFKSKDEGVSKQGRFELGTAAIDDSPGKSHLTERLGFLEKQIETLLSLQRKNQVTHFIILKAILTEHQGFWVEGKLVNKQRVAM